MQSERTAVIGGSGFSQLDDLGACEEISVATPYGIPSAALLRGEFCGRPFLFLPRHGANHALPPHRINYRANLWALRDAGATRVIALAAVGGINSSMQSRDIVMPDQLIDYTWGREHSFCDDADSQLMHVDFSAPYTPGLRLRLIAAARSAGLSVHTAATYAATQGPRLETAAEINRLERDGADIVGMTGMPEAALARELELEYATIAMVVNPAAGRSSEPISMSLIMENLAVAGQSALAILRQYAVELATS